MVLVAIALVTMGVGVNARTALGGTPVVLDRLVTGLDEAAWRARPAADEWAPVEIVCHLRHEEDGADRRMPLRVDDAGPIPYAGRT